MSQRLAFLSRTVRLLAGVRPHARAMSVGTSTGTVQGGIKTEESVDRKDLMDTLQGETNLDNTRQGFAGGQSNLNNRNQGYGSYGTARSGEQFPDYNAAVDANPPLKDGFSAARDSADTASQQARQISPESEAAERMTEKYMGRDYVSKLNEAGDLKGQWKAEANEKGSEVRDAAANAWEGAKDKAESAWEGIKQGAKEAKAAVAGGGAGFKAGEAWQGVKDTVKDAAGSVSAAAESGVEQAKEKAGDLWQAAKDTASFTASAAADKASSAANRTADSTREVTSDMAKAYSEGKEVERNKPVGGAYRADGSADTEQDSAAAQRPGLMDQLRSQVADTVDSVQSKESLLGKAGSVLGGAAQMVAGVAGSAAEKVSSAMGGPTADSRRSDRRS